MNKFDEMKAAVGEAQHTLAAADACVNTMAALCAGRLRAADVGAYHLKRLKDELRDYNIHTGRWKVSP